MIEPKTFRFLENLAQNNSREWFQDHRKEYEAAKENFLDFASAVLDGLKEIQPNLYNTDIKKCILRINRDIRFSKDKSPYKTYLAAGFGPGGKSSGLVDYYLQVQPSGSFLGAGMWQPSGENLAKFRQEIDYNPEVLKGIIFDKKFTDYFPEVHGETLKTNPRGYDPNHPDIDLLRRKELFFLHYYSDAQAQSKSFAREVIMGCSIIKPYQDYLNQLFFDQ